jgi:hypothetical protein
MREKKKIEYNWFGGGVTKSKKKKTISFLGWPPKSRISNKVNFLGKPTNYKMNPSSLFKKEKINQKRRLSKWGDADMDGSPNYFDCDPKHFLKDGKISKVLSYVSETLGGKGKDPGEIATERAAKAREKYEQEYDVTQKEAARLAKNIAAEKELLTLKEEAGYKVTKGEKKEIKRLERVAKTKATQMEKALDKRGRFVTQLESAPESYKKLKKSLELGGPKAAYRISELAIESKLAAGKPVSKKEAATYVSALKKVSPMARAGRFAKALRVGVGVAGVVGGYGLARTKGGERIYNQDMAARSARVRKMTEKGMGLLFGPSISAKGFASEPRGRGRPAGPSGEYRIGGRPVYEEEFRQWEAKQNALNRMLPSEAQSQTLNPEYLEYMKAQELQKRRESARLAQLTQQQRMQQQPTAPTQEGEMAMEEGEEEINEPVPSDQAPKTEGMTNEEVQAIEEARLRPYTRASPDEIREAQHMAQKRDNILNAPNILKGELKAAGGSILTPMGPQIMDAPNAFAGEMRNVSSEGDVPAVRLSERPQTNPYGDEYLEIELGSGKPVVRKRIREKWMTGEAL